MEDEYKVVCALSNSVIFDDLEWPRTKVSRSPYSLKANISQTVHPIHSMFASRVFEFGGSNGAICGSIKSKMAADGHIRMTAPSRVTLASAGLSCISHFWTGLEVSGISPRSSQLVFSSSRPIWDAIVWWLRYTRVHDPNGTQNRLSYCVICSKQQTELQKQPGLPWTLYSRAYAVICYLHSE